MRPEPVTVALSTEGLEWAGKPLTSVTFSRMATGRDLETCDGLGQFAATIALIARLTGVHRDIIRSFEGRDIKACSDAMAPFVGVSLD